jgi:hypothetical protein
MNECILEEFWKKNNQILDPEYQLNSGKNMVFLDADWKGLMAFANQSLEMF